MPTRSQSSLLRVLNAQLPEMVSTLRRYVEQESPSGSPDAIDSLVSLIALDFAPLSPRIRQHNLRGHGPAYYGPALQIDGLGAVGDGSHASDEFVVARQMPRRSALLAELITSLADA
jgi:acetylornithine deacetylase/succinyl-diaminopimelate desuccinylase-like protein